MTSEVTNSNQSGANVAGKSINEVNLNAWILGAMLSRYAAAAAHGKTHLANSYFEKAGLTANGLGLKIKPLTDLSELPAENYQRVTDYFLSAEGEGINLAATLDETYGALVSGYFLVIVKCYLLLLMYRPDPTGRALAESALTHALSLRHLTVIPEKYFSQLISAVKRGVERELLEAVTEDFYTSISGFLFDRFRHEDSPPEKETTNPVKDAFTILYFLASVDGEIDERELQIIVDFTNRQRGQINFDARRTIMDLAALTGAGRIAEYDRALFDFKKSSSTQDRVAILDLAVKLAAADGAVADGEKILFEDMASVWEIDLQAYFKEAGVSYTPRAAAAPPTITLSTAGVWVGDKLVAVAAPDDAPAARPSKKILRANFFAWSLGSSLSLYALNEAFMNRGEAQKHFELARPAALGVGVHPQPLAGITNDLVTNQVILLGYFLKHEGVRLGVEMDVKCGAPVSDYFHIIVRTYILLMMYSPAEKAQAEKTLIAILAIAQNTFVTHTYFLSLMSAIRAGASYETLKPLVSDLDATIANHLHLRINV